MEVWFSLVQIFLHLSEDKGVSKPTPFFETLRLAELFQRGQSAAEVHSEAKFGPYRKEDRKLPETKKNPRLNKTTKSGETEPAGFRRNGSRKKIQGNESCC